MVYFVGFGNWFTWHYFKTEWALFVGPIVGRFFIFFYFASSFGVYLVLE